MKTKQLFLTILVAAISLGSLHVGKFLVDGHHHYSSADVALAFLLVTTTLTLSLGLRLLSKCAFNKECDYSLL